MDHDIQQGIDGATSRSSGLAAEASSSPKGEEVHEEPSSSMFS